MSSQAGYSRFTTPAVTTKPKTTPTTKSNTTPTTSGLATVGTRYVAGLGVVPVTTISPTAKGVTKIPTAPQGQKLTWSDGYTYNAPMVKESYFGSQSFENTVLEGNFIDQGKYTDARNAWKGGFTGGRGTIQMDDKFLNSYATSMKTKPSSSFDTKKYGFKFLYNPQTVSMAWGMIQEMDPTYESMAQDVFQVISTALMTSTVSFELMLNRINDFKYIDENGFMNKPPELVYPEKVTDEEAALIYQKGTMYDLEYFFKTVNGPDATFTSDLNGTTADKAWLRPTIVELHLGDGMRYRVRIGDFAVNHLIFNPRMVPILSTVRLTCNRFIDGPEVAKQSALGKLTIGQ